MLLLTLGQLSAQCLEYSGCSATPSEVCDYSPNNAQLWNELYWWDNQLQTHDLSETASDISITVVANCAGIFKVKYTLFLDLNGDEIMETVVQSDTLPGFNTVYFNNLGNPNYGGGTARSFDERPVPPVDKYGFALETQSSGNSTTAHLRWNTSAAPNNFVEPQLPYGKHKITWSVMDSLGNLMQCTQDFEVKDCKKPTVVCLNGLSVNIMPTGMITLWASDFLQYIEDNSTPVGQIKIALRKCGTGTGFPVDFTGNPAQNVSFNCDEIGIQCVELWAIDAAGNADYCETYVIVQDNIGNCGMGNMGITTCIENWCNHAPLHEVVVNIDGSSNFTPPYSYFDLNDSINSNGCSVGLSNVPIASTFSIAPEKDDFPSNGVTVLDLIKIRRFLMGFDTDLSPYAMVAADANKSGSITSFDIIELRKLIIGIYQELPNNTSWRFIDASFAFPNAQNPFQTAFPEFVSIEDAVLSSYQASFKAIKIGDLDCDAWQGLQAPVQDRGLPQRSLTLPDATLLKGETTEIALQMAEPGDWAGLQMGLQFDPEKVEIMQVSAGGLPSFDADAIHQSKPGMLSFVWVDGLSQRIVPEQDLLKLRIRALESLKVSDVFKASDDFDNLGSLGDEPHTLTLDFRQFEHPSASGGETSIFTLQPNPTSEGASIPVRLSQAEKVKVEIADISGKTIWANELELSAGSHLLEIAAQSMSQGGVYVWRVVAGSKSASGKLVKI